MHGRRAISRAALLLALLALLAVLPAAPAATTEHALAEEVAASVRDGTVEWMTVGADRFPVVVREPERPEAEGVVLIVPEPGAHADWPDVVRPLRLGLAAAGWQTVSMQMPAAGDDGDFRDVTRARARLGFLLESLQAGGVERIVVLAHGRAYRTVVTHVNEALAATPALVRGLVLVSPELPRAGLGTGAVADPLAAMAMPLLELHGSEDRAAVLELVREHARLQATGVLPGRRGRVVDGARGDYRGQADLLVRRVRGWLGTLPRDAQTE